LQDEWEPQENVDEEMESAGDNSDDDSSDDDHGVDGIKPSPTDRKQKSTETAMERDSDDD